MATSTARLTGAKETLLLTLRARAEHARSANPILRDPYAVEVCDRMGERQRPLKTSASDIGVVVRANRLDRWAEDFLAREPDATVIHLGCGLDSRVFRLAPPASTRWYDVDFPEVIELRRELYEEPPGYRALASSVTEPEWLEELPRGGRVLVIAEGLLMYLTEATVALLLSRLLGRFDGGELIADLFSPLACQVIRAHPGFRETGAKVGWGIGDSRSMENWGLGLRLRDEFGLLEDPELTRLPAAARRASRLVGSVRPLRRAHRLARFTF